MRPIKFRGKVLKDKQTGDNNLNWFYGDLVRELKTKKTFILDLVKDKRFLAKAKEKEAIDNTVRWFNNLPLYQLSNKDTRDCVNTMRYMIERSMSGETLNKKYMIENAYNMIQKFKEHQSQYSEEMNTYLHYCNAIKEALEGKE